MANGSRSLPPLDALAAALAAREQGSFTAAAAALNVTHTAVSRRVAVAERWSGAPLFERHGRGVRTTAHGERLLARLDAMLDGIGQLAQPDRAAPRRHVLRVATTPSFARHRLLPTLKRIERDDLRFEIVAEGRNADLRAAGIDLAIRYGRGGWRAGKEIALPRAPLLPVLCRDLVTEMPNGPEGVAMLPLIHNADATLWRAWCAAHGIERRAKAADRTLFDYDAALEAARAGLGVALLDPVLHPDPKPDERVAVLRNLPLDDPPLGYHSILPDGAVDAARTALERLIAP